MYKDAAFVSHKPENHYQFKAANRTEDSRRQLLGVKLKEERLENFS